LLEAGADPNRPDEVTFLFFFTISYLAAWTCSVSSGLLVDYWCGTILLHRVLYFLKIWHYKSMHKGNRRCKPISLVLSKIVLES
jgi:hypothetical protein